jgi:hypothetical protein
VASTATSAPGSAPSDGRRTSIDTPVDVSLWVSAYRSIPARPSASGWVPGGEVMTSGSSRNGAADTPAANFDENSPNDRCCDLRSTSPKIAASQNSVVPPLPSTTS